MSAGENDFEGVDFGKFVVLWCDACQAFHSEAAGCVSGPQKEESKP